MKNQNPNLPEQTELLDPDLVHTYIALRAYQLYKARGFLDGFDLQDWLQAERETLEQPEAFFLLLKDLIPVRVPSSGAVEAVNERDRDLLDKLDRLVKQKRRELQKE